MADSPEEKAHWRSVLKAFDGYMQYHLSANHARRMAFLQLPKDQKEMYEAIGFRDKLDAVDEGIRRNAEFIDELIADPVFSDMLGDSEAHAHEHAHTHTHADHGHSHSHEHSLNAPTSNGSDKQSKKRDRSAQAENDLAQDKIRSTLRSLVRDWAAEGRGEREACHDPCIRALEAHYPAGGRNRGEVKVLIPGCGLGRLAMEIASKGFFSQGNEFSAYMLITSNFILNQSSAPGAYEIYPYLHSFSNHKSTMTSVLRRVAVPDVVPADVLTGEGKGGEFSLVAGDFEEIYGEDASQRGQWGAVVTCFFIDCARNILSFLRIIHDLLEPGGVWINIGPLLWHFENSVTRSSKGESSIELSLDEVKELARNVGFDLTEEKEVRSTYTGVPDGMLRHEYEAAFWIATKRHP